MNMMMFDPMGFGRGTPNVFRYVDIVDQSEDRIQPLINNNCTENVSIFVNVYIDNYLCLPVESIDIFHASFIMIVFGNSYNLCFIQTD